MCIFHLSKSHFTENCYLKKECDWIRSQTKDSHVKPSTQSGTTVGQLRHVTEDMYEQLKLMLLRIHRMSLMILMKLIYCILPA